MGFSNVFPHGHPALVEPLGVWAAFLTDQGKFDEGIEFRRKIIDIYQHFSNMLPEDEIHQTLDIAQAACRPRTL